MESEIAKLINQKVKVIYQDDLGFIRIKRGTILGVDDLFLTVEAEGKDFIKVIIPIKQVLRVEVLKEGSYGNKQNN